MWRAAAARLLARSAHRETVKAWRFGEHIDPIEELARIIGEAQERDAKDEGRFDELARMERPEPRAAVRSLRTARRS